MIIQKDSTVVELEIDELETLAENSKLIDIAVKIFSDAYNTGNFMMPSFFMEFKHDDY